MSQKQLLLCSLLCVVVLAGCQSGRRVGAVFTPYSPPSADDSLVYLYRVDSLRGVDPVDVRVDDERVGDMRNKEYLVLVLPPGEHSVAVRRRWLGLVPLAWTDHTFRTEAGSITYVRMWAGYEEHEIPGAANSAPGRSDGSTSVSLFVSRWGERKAVPEISGCREAPGE